MDFHHEQVNRNIQHRDALRLALGSILTPKRPFTPSASQSLPVSQSPSGTASPAHPHYLSTTPSPCGSPVVPPPPHPTPSHGVVHGRFVDAQGHLYPMHYFPHPHPHSHPHTPSRLGTTDPSNADYVTFKPAQHEHDQSAPDQLPRVAQSDVPVPTIYVPEAIPADSVNGHFTHTASAAPSYVVRPEEHAPTADTPKAHFITTLQSKSAWDALIHGSFS